MGHQVPTQSWTELETGRSKLVVRWVAGRGDGFGGELGLFEALRVCAREAAWEAVSSRL